MPAPWRELLSDEFAKPYYAELERFVVSEYDRGEVFPPEGQIFRAFELCDPDRVKVVIIGQDPYHGEGQANGLAFSVARGVKIPPSLVNIFKEVAASGFTADPTSGELERWAQQGVLLLNSVLTVGAHQAASHASRGWERLTDAAIAAINKQQSGVVYMLWGSYAQKKAAIVDDRRNLVLRSVHPSPLSAYRGFIGCGHFKAANNYLAEPINW